MKNIEHLGESCTKKSVDNKLTSCEGVEAVKIFKYFNSKINVLKSRTGWSRIFKISAYFSVVDLL